MVKAIIPNSISDETETKYIIKKLDIVRNRNFKNYIVLFMLVMCVALVGNKIAKHLNEPYPEYPPSDSQQPKPLTPPS